MVEGTEVQVPWATTEVGVEIPLPVYWFVISATTVGRTISGDHLGGLVASRISIYLAIITRGASWFGFVQYYDPADAADAKYHLDGYVLLGREITVVFAEENRKKPSEMRQRSRGRTSTRSPYGHSRSPVHPRSPNYRRSYSRSPYDDRHHSRSVSPGPGDRKRSYSRSSSRSRYESRSRSPSPGY